MSTNVSKQRPEKDYFARLSALESRVQQMRTTQAQGADAVNLQTSADCTLPFTFSAGGGANFLYTFSNADNRKLFGTFEFTLYQGSIAPGNEVGNGLNVFDFNWDFRYWRSKWDSDGNNLKEWVKIKNISAGTLDLIMVGSWRFILSSGAGST
jgi:hypothetical protein